MPRGRRIIINRKLDDETVKGFVDMKPEGILKERKKEEKKLYSSINNIVKSAEELYQRRDREEFQRKNLLSIQEAYDYLRGSGMNISFRAFGGRIERKSIYSIKIGKKRYIPMATLDDLLNLGKKFYSVKDAYEMYKQSNSKINYRAFIGRVEKGSVPSVKIGTKRLIPRDAMGALTHISKKYHTVSQAIDALHKKGIGIKRNAFERRLDRGRIPHLKIGGRRFIPNDVVKELIEKEVALRRK
ncbi:hypothetical protein KAW38_03560 [Candidatus Micrarchaeota archaeon]|nr:hypothetical protein [Candidatus Micrarchaeota archaeon]